MEINLNELWKEFELDETLEEHVKKSIQRRLEKADEIINEHISEKIDMAIVKIEKKLSEATIFAKCADTKINQHLTNHKERMND